MELDAKRNNFFSFFSGYLHLPITAPRIHLDIDDFYGPRKAEPEPDGPLAPHAAPVAPEDFAVGRSPLPLALEPDPWQPLDLAAAVRPITPFSARLPTLPAKPLPPDPVKYSNGGGNPSPDPSRPELLIKVEYKDGGNQFDMRVNQLNALHDSDVITVRQDNDVITDDGQSVAWPEHDVPSISEPLNIAHDSVPEVYQPFVAPIAIGSGGLPTVIGPGATTETVVATLEAQGDAYQGQDGPPPTLLEGTTTDGQHAAPGSSTLPLTGPSNLIPAPPAKDPVNGESPDNTAVVKTGDNNVFNFGGIVDAQGNVGTMYVLGDSYRSDVIVQTNVIVDDTAVAGTADSATLQTGGNQANNVAEFIQTLAQNPYEMGFFGGLQWNVDRVNGDYFNVNLTSQLNVMKDNDKVQQTASEHYKYYETGANEQGNGLVLDHSGIQYDLVIVTGNYYGANWIFQTNILLNSDYVLINGGSGEEGSQTVSTGANWLLNSATLVDYSGGTHTLTPDMQALVAALQGGEGTLDLENGFLVPGNGDRTLNVLFIDGNYYDINVLEQTNIVSDSDVVAQTLENGETGYVSTGGNTLSNDALLATLGPLGGQYVGGNQYTEATLVQTNIIVQSADVPPTQSTVVLNDPSKLASEAAVMIEHSATPALPPPEQSAPPPSVDSAGHTTTDPLSSVLS